MKVEGIRKHEIDVVGTMGMLRNYKLTLAIGLTVAAFIALTVLEQDR
jgi:hypothetical protein